VEEAQQAKFEKHPYQVNPYTPSTKDISLVVKGSQKKQVDVV